MENKLLYYLVDIDNIGYNSLLNMKPIVKLNHFFSAGISLLEKAAVIIHNTKKSSGFTALSKGQIGNDVFTFADMHIQNTVKYNLK